MIEPEIPKNLTELPDQVADAKLKYRKASLDREKTEAVLYLRFKAEDTKRTTDEVKALVKSNYERYEMALAEYVAESDYDRLYERLMSFKRLAGLREAF